MVSLWVSMPDSGGCSGEYTPYDKGGQSGWYNQVIGWHWGVRVVGLRISRLLFANRSSIVRVHCSRM